MKKLRTLLMVLAILCVGCTRSKESQGAVAARPVEEELRPSPEMQKLFDAFLGDWEVRENFEVSASGQGGTRRGTASFRAGPGFSLIEDYNSSGSAGDLHALALLWWDPSARVYQYLTCANNDGCELRGTAKWEGKTLVNSWQEKDMGKVPVFRDSFVDISPSGFRQISEGTVDGKTIWHVTTTATRLRESHLIGRSGSATRMCVLRLVGDTFTDKLLSPCHPRRSEERRLRRVLV